MDVHLAKAGVAAVTEVMAASLLGGAPTAGAVEGVADGPQPTVEPDQLMALPGHVQHRLGIS
ncbi:hypothetical protein MMF93_00390 [Streptomyces tubbatahanensis]|uniref:Uncharacterized protein n=1 Tax=Streptomyces tubbatahanensis TaxID=2923272 RepID=A0ABY3XL03_9ACTN|nr:hypothetical protein [Streptomyces tubbatahanensis]UNS95090.1 hypothetical protein MMF93_00390 [Streptomyces tubbatahanensis]